MLDNVEYNLIKYLNEIKNMNQFDFVYGVGDSPSFATWKAMQAVATNALRIIEGKEPPYLGAWSGQMIKWYYIQTDDGKREPLPHP